MRLIIHHFMSSDNCPSVMFSDDFSSDCHVFDDFPSDCHVFWWFFKWLSCFLMIFQITVMSSDDFPSDCQVFWWFSRFLWWSFGALFCCWLLCFTRSCAVWSPSLRIPAVTQCQAPRNIPVIKPTPTSQVLSGLALVLATKSSSMATAFPPVSLFPFQCL